MPPTTNFSLQSLSINRAFGSPLFSSSLSTRETRFYMKKSIFSDIFTNAIYSIRNMNLRECNFNKFTSSVVRVDNMDSVKMFFSSSVLYEANEEYSFSMCVFQKTKTSDSGGAICILSSSGVFSAKSSGFTICLSQNNGGGISFTGSKFDIEKCCFLGCLAMQHGQAVDMSGDDGLQGRIEVSSIEQCSPIKSPGHSQSVFIRHGTNSLVSLNSSFNHVVDMGSCLCVAHNKGFSLNFCTYIGCTGANGFWFHQFSNNDMFTSCNIIKLSSNKELGMMTFENSSVNFNSFVFIQNECPVYFISGSLRLILCSFDVKKFSKIAVGCSLDIIDTAFGVKYLRPRPLPPFITWECWAMGMPSPTPSKSLVPIEERSNSSINGIYVFAFLLFAGFLSGYGGFYFMNKTSDFQAVIDTRLSNLEIEQ